MLRDGTWDIKCPQEMCNLFPNRRGYYYKVNNSQAQLILDILSKKYGIEAPIVIPIRKSINANAAYRPPNRVYLYSRNHLKSVWHEFYHHLDFHTAGKYNSDDRGGGRNSLA